MTTYNKDFDDDDDDDDDDDATARMSEFIERLTEIYPRRKSRG